MAKTMKPLGEIRDNAEADSINVKRYVNELFVVTMDLAKACGIMFEKEHLRFIAMFRRRGTMEEAEEVSTEVSWNTRLS